MCSKEIFNMYLYDHARFKDKSAVLPAGSSHRSRSISGDNRVTGRLLFTALTGLLAGIAAIFTTMVQRGETWRYSWLAVCILSASLLLIGIFGIYSAIDLPPVSTASPQPGQRGLGKMTEPAGFGESARSFFDVKHFDHNRS